MPDLRHPPMTMTSRERVIRSIERKPTDVIAAAPFILDLAATYYGVSIREFGTDGRVMADAQFALQRELAHDAIFVGLDNYYIAAPGTTTARAHCSTSAAIRARC